MNQASVEAQRNTECSWKFDNLTEHTECSWNSLGLQFGYDILSSTYLWQHTQGSLGEHRVVCHLDIHRDVSLEFGLWNIFQTEVKEKYINQKTGSNNI